MHRLVSTIIALFAVSMTLAAGTAGADSARVVNGEFPIDDHFVDSDICEFPVAFDFTGIGKFNARLDDQGLNLRVNVHERTVGTVSANGIELRAVSSFQQIFDFRSFTKKEVGLVFRDNLPGGGVVLMDRGLLILNFDPNTGETFGDPIFVAGHHVPEGNFGALCAALTP